MADVITERITRTPGICGGKPCIAGHRVRVMDVVIWHEHLGMSADEIVTQIPSITLSDVHAALAYYFDHLDKLREEIKQEFEFADQFIRSYPSPVQAKLRKLLGENSR